MLSKAFVAIVALALAAPVLAGTPGLDRREHHQMQRIHQGMRSGELTRAETARLVHGQAHLRRSEALAKRDGVVTARERARLQPATHPRRGRAVPARERARLQHQANVQSRHIYRQKHDAQDRG